jgi:hypothetical protein
MLHQACGLMALVVTLVEGLLVAAAYLKYSIHHAWPGLCAALLDLLQIKPFQAAVLEECFWRSFVLYLNMH